MPVGLLLIYSCIEERRGECSQYLAVGGYISPIQELREEWFEREKKKSFPIYHGLENQQKAADRQAVGG